MWSYYGSKSKIAKIYPRPAHSLIIEPFAGAAWYSVMHRSKDVILNDKYALIYGIWHWLINQASPSVILEHSDFYEGDDIRHLPIDDAHKDLLGFCINRGSATPCNIVQGWSCQVKSRPGWASTTNYQLRRISKLLPQIRHWSARCGDYRELPDIEATWFIDPPYQHGGKCYQESAIDYLDLADWVSTRKGQVIVCENTKADWLDFKPLTQITGQRVKTTEAIFYK